MMNSKFATITAPLVTTANMNNAATNSSGPNAIAQAMKVPLRVVVRNLSNGASVFLSEDGSSLMQTVPASMSYELPAGAADVFLLAPLQKLYLVSATAGVKVSIHISEALPIDKQP